MDIYDLTSTATVVVSAAAGWVQTHPERAITWSLIGGIAGWAISRQWYQNYVRHSFFKAMGREMTSEDRRNFLDSKAADALADFQMEMWAKHKMSWQEVKAQCKRLGLQMPLRDLLPVSNHPKAIRHRVEQAIAAMKGIGPKHPIPGPKPGEDVKVSAPVVSLTAFARLRNRKKASSAA